LPLALARRISPCWHTANADGKVIHQTCAPDPGEPMRNNKASGTKAFVPLATTDIHAAAHPSPSSELPSASPGRPTLTDAETKPQHRQAFTCKAAQTGAAVVAAAAAVRTHMRDPGTVGKRPASCRWARPSTCRTRRSPAGVLIHTQRQALSYVCVGKKYCGLHKIRPPPPPPRLDDTPQPEIEGQVLGTSVCGVRPVPPFSNISVVCGKFLRFGLAPTL